MYKVGDRIVVVAEFVVNSYCTGFEKSYFDCGIPGINIAGQLITIDWLKRNSLKEKIAELENEILAHYSSQIEQLEHEYMSGDEVRELRTERQGALFAINRMKHSFGMKK